MRLGRDLPLDEQIGLDRLLDDAFAAGRRRRAPIAAARVRARIAWERPREMGPAGRGIALLGRMGQAPAALALILALSAGASAGPEPSVDADGAPVATTARSVAREIDDFRLKRFRVAAVPAADDMLDPQSPPRGVVSSEPDGRLHLLQRGVAR